MSSEMVHSRYVVNDSVQRSANQMCFTQSNFALDAILCHALNFSSAHTTYTARGLFTAAASGDDMDIVNRILLGKVDGFVTVPRKHVVGVIQQ